MLSPISVSSPSVAAHATHTPPGINGTGASICPQDHHHRTLLDILPLELWEHVFALCTLDGGQMANVLRLVSKETRRLSAAHRFRSVTILKLGSLMKFVKLLEDETARAERDDWVALPKVEYLYVCTPSPGTDETRDEDDEEYAPSCDLYADSDSDSQVDAPSGCGSNLEEGDDSAGDQTPPTDMTRVISDSLDGMELSESLVDDDWYSTDSFSSESYDLRPLSERELAQVAMDMQYFEAQKEFAQSGEPPGSLKPTEWELSFQNVTISYINRLLPLVHKSVRSMVLQVCVFIEAGESTLYLDYPFPKLVELETNLDMYFPSNLGVSLLSACKPSASLPFMPASLPSDDTIYPHLETFTARVITVSSFHEQLLEILTVTPRLRVIQFFVHQLDWFKWWEVVDTIKLALGFYLSPEEVKDHRFVDQYGEPTAEPPSDKAALVGDAVPRNDGSKASSTSNGDQTAPTATLLDLSGLAAMTYDGSENSTPFSSAPATDTNSITQANAGLVFEYFVSPTISAAVYSELGRWVKVVLSRPAPIVKASMMSPWAAPQQPNGSSNTTTVTTESKASLDAGPKFVRQVKWEGPLPSSWDPEWDAWNRGWIPIDERLFR